MTCCSFCSNGDQPVVRSAPWRYFDTVLSLTFKREASVFCFIRFLLRTSLTFNIISGLGQTCNATVLRYKSRFFEKPRLLFVRLLDRQGWIQLETWGWGWDNIAEPTSGLLSDCLLTLLSLLSVILLGVFERCGWMSLLLFLWLLSSPHGDSIFLIGVSSHFVCWDMSRQCATNDKETFDSGQSVWLSMKMLSSAKSSTISLNGWEKSFHCLHCKVHPLEPQQWWK